MIALWLTLLLLHQAYTLAPVNQVQLGEPVTITCDLAFISNRKVFRFKQSAGDALKLIVRRLTNTNNVFGAEFSAFRFDLKVNQKMSHLTILRTVQEDEGMYHCVVLDWSEIILSATYLSIKGNYVISEFVALVIAIVCLVISVIGNIVFICHRSPSNKDTLVYSAVIFTMMRADSRAVKDATAVERERIYAAVKAFRLDQ
uniref:uncharacterized protein n=1 Tax=Semicossyphus pulcher TaxID=241346 RepID=UPI0037E83553